MLFLVTVFAAAPANTSARKLKSIVKSEQKPDKFNMSFGG